MTATKDAMVAYIERLHEDFQKEREAIRTRTLAMGYVFGRAAERVADGGDVPDDHAMAFADFYEKHTDGSWADLSKKYDEFHSGKDAPK